MLDKDRARSNRIGGILHQYFTIDTERGGRGHEFKLN